MVRDASARAGIQDPTIQSSDVLPSGSAAAALGRETSNSEVKFTGRLNHTADTNSRRKAIG
jgi:hypothetical protein